MNGPARRILKFEQLEAGHVPAVMAIENEAYPEPWTENMFRQELYNPASEFYVAFFEGILVGYGGFWRVGGEAHITSVTVANNYRGQGFGRTLVEYLLQGAGDLGLREATLEVRESNTRAYFLYERMGFETVGRRKGYYRRTNEDALVMRRSITNPEKKIFQKP